jgi:hypothetical protein
MENVSLIRSHILTATGCSPVTLTLAIFMAVKRHWTKLKKNELNVQQVRYTHPGVFFF